MSGYTRVENDVLDSLIASNLSGTELSCALLVYRKTVGWGKASDTISLTQFTTAIGVTRKAVCNALDVLKLVKIITLVKKGNQNHTASEFRFNEDVSLWELVKKNTLVKKTSKTSVKNFQELVKKTTPSKDTITKETIQKKVSPLFLEDSIEFRCAQGMYKVLLHEHPKMKPPNLQKWAQEFDRMIRLDNRTFEEIVDMIRFARGDPFWKKNILSPEKLRKHWDKLHFEKKEQPTQYSA